MSSKPVLITAKTNAYAAKILAANDPLMGKLFHDQGVPPLWNRGPGFASLVHIILEQQVSLASGKAAFTRLCEAIDPFTPEEFLTLSDSALKGIGFSRQKSGYCRFLAQGILSGSISLEEIAVMDDVQAYQELVKIKGIGPWTAHIYLLMGLSRSDIWPQGDLALMNALQVLTASPERLALQQAELMAERWRPFRSVAARMLWQYYLSNPQAFKGSKI